MSIGGSYGLNLGIININAAFALVATGNDAALVYGFDHGIGEFTKPGLGGGITLNAHNLFGSSTDILSELGGEDLSLGYGIKASYGTSSSTVGNKTSHAESGAKTYGLGFGYGVGVSRSKTMFINLVISEKTFQMERSKIQNTVLQAITPPKMF